MKIWLKTAKGQLDILRPAGRRKSTECSGLPYLAPCLSQEVQNGDSYFAPPEAGLEVCETAPVGIPGTGYSIPDFRKIGTVRAFGS